MKCGVDGTFKTGVGAKDIILNLISRIGIGGGNGCVFEFTGPAIQALSMEERMTVCNMSIEGGARAGMIAPDDTTYQYLAGRRYAPKGADWDRAVGEWNCCFIRPCWSACNSDLFIKSATAADKLER